MSLFLWSWILRRRWKKALAFCTTRWDPTRATTGPSSLGTLTRRSRRPTSWSRTSSSSTGTAPPHRDLRGDRKLRGVRGLDDYMVELPRALYPAQSRGQRSGYPREPVELCRPPRQRWQLRHQVGGLSVHDA